MQTPLHQVLVSRLIGGAGLVAIRLAASASARGYRARAWVPGTGPASAALDREHVVWTRYDLEATRGPIIQHLFACSRMIPRLLGWKRPIVHVHNPVVYRLLRPALVVARARTVVHFQIEPTEAEIEWALRDPPDHVIACARYIAERINQVSRAVRVMRVSAVPNAVDLERFSPGSTAAARQRAGLSTTRFVVAMVANLAPHKGQTTAIRAAALLLGRGVPVECWLIGEDRSDSRDYERQLRSLCVELGVEQAVRFLGFRNDVPDLLRAADVFVLPSTYEGLPLSLVEAQAAGIPVIGSPIPGIREVVEDGQTGLIVPSDDAAGYADRIQELRNSPELRGRLVGAATERVHREYGWAIFEERMFSIYAALDSGLPDTA